ncbi:DUF2125 domain-containing protein [Parasulfitobacter algicola]|uniref:DUF2125 domain-containing protein n=1 Tax=Parasulfitobacter algicola TaxID=2614809 RepID=A0ABX2IMN1_9RHOB|nr:DUF2125 domain-containing protein [Sulfitobacter algicola]NSX53790.1 DUF2125 domain-containing protein [Sulfitobacter algicola]
MTLVTKTSCSLAAFFMTTTAVFADVTPEQVWDDWQKSLAMYGEELDMGTTVRAGASLKVSGVGFTTVDGTNEVIASFPDMTLTDQGDGTVAVTLDTDYLFTFKDTSPFAGFAEAIFRVTDQNFAMVVSGSPEEMVYDVTADAMIMALDEIKPAPGDEPLDVTFSIAANGIEGKYLVTPGDVRKMTQDITVENSIIKFNVEEPSDAVSINLDGVINTITLTGETATPTDIDMSNPAAMFGPDSNIAGGYTFGDAAYTFLFSENGSVSSGGLTSRGTKLDVAMGDSIVSYTGESQDVAFNMQSNALPFPVNLNMESYGFAFGVPVAKSDDLKDVQVGLSLREFVMDDQLWNIFDPTQVLPRDPATIAIDISGKAKMLVDILDPEQADQMMMVETPIEVDQMNLNSLTIEAAGATVTGDGGFTFDNTDLDTFDGVPRPQGEVNLMVVGANGLIDNLIAMGLLPEDQAMGARMMMGMFAVPGEGDDTLTSKIEVNDQGHVLANGQRLR